MAEQPYEYEKHVELVTLLRDAGELDQLRDAREKMNRYFPLAPSELTV